MNTRVVGDVIVVYGISAILFQCIYYSELHKLNNMSEGECWKSIKLEFRVALDAFDARDSQVCRFLWALLYYCISIFIAFISSCAHYAILWCVRVSYLIFSYKFSRWMAFVILCKIFQFPMSSRSLTYQTAYNRNIRYIQCCCCVGDSKILVLAKCVVVTMANTP